MTSRAGRFFGIAIVALTLTGCGNKAIVSDADTRAFDKAAPEIKQMWDKGYAAAKANDYVTAEMVLFRLMRADLTEEQKQAVSHQITEVGQRLSDALEKGDPAAKAAHEQLTRNPPNRQP